MFRTVLATSRRGVAVRPACFATTRAFSTSRTSRFFGGKPSGDISEDQAKTISQFGETLKNNPELSRLLDGFQTLLASKGITTGGQPPSLTQMMKILADKDIREHLGKLKSVLDSANIKINQQDLSALTDLYLSQKKQ